MANPSPSQALLRDRIEQGIALAAPLLDGLLSVGEVISRIVGPEDEYYSVRPAGQAFELIPAQRPVLDADRDTVAEPAPTPTGDAE